MWRFLAVILSRARDPRLEQLPDLTSHICYLLYFYQQWVCLAKTTRNCQKIGHQPLFHQTKVLLVLHLMHPHLTTSCSRFTLVTMRRPSTMTTTTAPAIIHQRSKQAPMDTQLIRREMVLSSLLLNKASTSRLHHLHRTKDLVGRHQGGVELHSSHRATNKEMLPCLRMPT